MTDGDGKLPAQRLGGEPRVLATIPPSVEQRRAAQMLVLALLAIMVATWPFATIKLPEVSAFVPSLAAALFVSDSVTAALLFGQFAIMRRWSLLIIASGYLFSALIVIAHALAFPTAFSKSGLMGSGPQSAVWLYWLWHSGLPIAIVGYSLLKSTDRVIDERWTRVAVIASSAAMLGLVVAIFWFVTQRHHLLPVTFVDAGPLSPFRRMIGGIVILVLGGFALGLLWWRRQTLLDEWLMVALWALLIEVALASVLSGDRFTLSWYAGRFYQLVTATVVMVVLLVETTKLYTEVARANELLQQERLLLQLAVQAQRRERAAKLMTGEAVAAAIAHEVKQPLSAMITHADAGLRFLNRPDPDQNEAKEAFTQIVADGHRAEVVIRSMRSLFATGDLKKELFDLNDLIEETLALMRADLEKHRIKVAVGLDRGLPKISGDRVQLQQVLVNLATNASDAMAKVDGARDLLVRLVSPDDDYVRLSIADTGVGVDAQDAERIFNPLFSTKPDGMGMGLAICRSIIQAHEGQLWMSPNTPRGAVFHISLPRSA